MKSRRITNSKGGIITHRRRARRLGEIALGKPLPPFAIMHHIDYNQKDNINNLVLCQDQSYHMLLHQRTDALRACGNKHWRRCSFCGHYDDPNNLTIRSAIVYHKRCKNLDTRMRGGGSN